MTTLNNNLGTTPPTAPGITTTATGTQTNRVTRTGVASACGSAKPFPGTLAVGPRAFDSYTFTACRATCLSAKLTSPNAATLFEVAYSPTFDPTNIAANYVADAGNGGNGQACTFSTVASTSYTLVVSDVTGTSVGSNYTLLIPSCALNCNTNHVPVAIAHNVTVTAAIPGGTANASINKGSFDPDGDTLTITQTPAGPYPVGNTNVLLTVVDPKGATTQASAMVTVLTPTITIVSSSLTPSTFSTSVTFTANVTPATATGTISFKDGSTILATSTLTGGVAIFTTNALAIGSHTITAVYSGDTFSISSTSPVLTQTITGTATATADIGVAVTHSPNNPVIAIGGKLAITVTVTNNDATNPAQVALTLSSISGPFEVDSVSAPGGASCDPPSGSAVQCNIATLAASSNTVFTINVRPLFSDQRTLTIVAAEASNTTDSNPANNTASDSIKVRFRAFRQ